MALAYLHNHWDGLTRFLDDGRLEIDNNAAERALRGDKVYLMDAEQKLVIKPVAVLFRHEQWVAIEGELNPGDTLVLNDLIPAIPGMSLKPVDTEEGAKL